MADSGGKPRQEGEDDEVVETDPEGRYYRYNDSVGRGKFKQIFKAFDTQIGIDVAWSKISAKNNHLTEVQLQAAVNDMLKGLDLEHPNVIKCFKCWEDYEHQEINLITELFTSGNLRQYRTQHKHLDIKAIKRMARQILKGLEYLHANQQAAITHGDLRCDKIYVNGHSGEIKIGDLGLATLLPYRWENPEMNSDNTLNTSWDIFAFGLCMLELLTLRELDPQHCQNYTSVLEEIADEEARNFVSKCLGPPETRPSALQLLEDPFLALKKVTAPGDSAGAGEGGSSSAIEMRRTDDSAEVVDPTAGAPIAVGKLRGEDYQFEFHGKVKDGKMHFRLIMTMAAEPGVEAPFLRTIDFVFDPEVDTPDKLAAEISEEFSLSPTDTEICAAALREWLAKEMPGVESK